MTCLTEMVALAALLLFSGGMGQATSYRKLDLIECLEMADQVVIGRLSGDSAKPELNVTEVLKGPPATVIRVFSNHIEGPQVEPDVLFMKTDMANPTFMPLTYLARGFGTWQLVHPAVIPELAMALEAGMEDANRILLRMDVPEAINWILDQDGELLSGTAVGSLY